MEFNEKKTEYSAKQQKEVEVWKTPKYEESKAKAKEWIAKKEYKLTEGDFWILMNETKSGKMAYTGLIISHNGCLKINDALAPELKFRSECLTKDKDAYANSLIYEYNCPEQGLYEVGEVNNANCKNAYPHAMAFKRCFDRVVLKNSKLAYAGIYSEAEAEEFKEPAPDEDELKPIPVDEVVGGAFVLTGGKYDGKTIQEVFEADPGYCEFCANNARTPIVKANFIKCLRDNNYIQTIEL